MTDEHSRGPLDVRHDSDRAVSVAASDVELMRYVYRPDEAPYESPKPYVHPLRTLGGRLVTVFRPWDHVWHKGICLALPVVGADNFWGGPSYRRSVDGYIDLPNNGSQDHDRMSEIVQRDGMAIIRHELVWRRQPLDPDSVGVSAFVESRALTTSLLPEGDAWALGWSTRLTNVSGEPIAMGSPTTEGRENAGYGGLFWRGPRSFTGGDVIGSKGTSGEDVRGTRGAWAGFSGRHDGEDGASTVLIVDRTTDQDLDTKWFARSDPFACLNPAPFFDRVRVVQPGESIELRYTALIADGASDASRMSALATSAFVAAERADAVAEEVR